MLLSATALALALAHGPAARADPPPLLERRVVAAAVCRAVARAGLGVEATRAMAARARASGWVPQVYLRGVRGLDATASTSAQPSDRTTTGDSLALDVRLRFQFDHVVFDPSEVPIARVELERVDRRAALEREVIDLLAAIEQSGRELRTADPEDPASVALEVRAAADRARLEALTGTSLENLLRSR
jgi:hypothetical protein